MSSKPEVGIAIVGYGGMGKAHAYAYRVAPMVGSLPCEPRVRVLIGRTPEAVGPSRSGLWAASALAPGTHGGPRPPPASVVRGWLRAHPGRCRGGGSPRIRRVLPGPSSLQRLAGAPLRPLRPARDANHATGAVRRGGPVPATVEGVPLGHAFIGFTAPFNFGGHPAATVRAGFTDSGLPVGLQIVGARHADALVLRASYAYEQARPWNRHWPRLEGTAAPG